MIDRLHPQLRELLEAMAPGLPAGTLEEQRAAYSRSWSGVGQAPPVIASAEDLEVPGAAGTLPARLYRPLESAQPAGLLVWLHGGGWTLGDLESHDGAMRALTAASGHAVLHVAYRLAPEHPFPAGRDDAVAALQWARSDAGRAVHGAGTDRVAVGGDSAGGNLAALAALATRGDGLPEVRLQVLVYPALDARMTGASYEEFAGGPMLTREDMVSCWRSYLGDADGREASPLALATEDLRGLPPAAIAVAAVDPLRDDGLRYVAALREAAVPVGVELYEDLTHGVLRLGGVLDRAREVHAWLGAQVAAALGGP